MTLLRNTVTEPDGSPLNGWLDVAIVGNPFQSATQSEVLGPIKDRQITGGAWSVDLAPGLYAVTQRRRDGAFHSRWTVEVPDSESAVWLADCLVAAPSSPASVALRAVTSTVVDEGGHLQVTYSDGVMVDAGPVVGPQGPPWTGSAAEFGQAVADEIDDETSAVNESLRAAFGRAAPVLSAFTYDPTTGNLLSYQEDGITITLTYNADGTVATSKRGTDATQTYSYTGGNLVGVA